MLAYVIRRSAYGLVTLFGVLLLLFVLFFLYASPLDMARRAVGEKAPQEVLEQWVANHGYDKPKLWNAERPFDTLLVDHFRRMLTFDFGRSDADGVPITQRLREGAGPSLALAVPSFALGLLFSVGLGLFVAYFRETYIDRMGVVLCVLTMSISTLLYIIGGQFLIGKLLRWFPISGFDPQPSVIVRFLMLPILVSLIDGVGTSVRFYRTVFIEESGRDYVRTARAKGCGDLRVMTHHVLRNALIPVLTRVVVAIPLLFTGSLLLESFFGIPGLGSMTVEAIQGNDFSTLRAMVFIGALLFIGAQILTDVSYTLVDPRVRLE
jgi:peptide/nickel transport system permease protein